jgi:menaquinol-cytochrome c reductase iron-sulfur subunit
MNAHAELPRRGWLQRLLAGGLAILAGLVPVGAGLTVFLDPLRRRGTVGGFVKVTSLASVPPDGVPRRFVVLAEQVNAWNRRSGVRVGAVFLRRTGEQDLRALNVTCPHAGCAVEYAAARRGFLCPCHDSTFALDGAVNDPRSPSPRGLDELEVEVRNTSEVWVRFRSFRAGVREKLAA